MPPVHLSGSRRGTRTAVVCTLVMRKRACTLGSSQPIVNHLAIVNNTGSDPGAPAASRWSRRCARRSSPGKLEDGERLIEDKIARELKTSRGPGARGVEAARARGIRRLVPVSRRRRARCLRRGGARGADPRAPDAREVQHPEGGRAHGGRGLRRAREGGLDDGRGGEDERPAEARSTPTSASTSSCSSGRASRTRRRSGARSRRGSARTSSATAAATCSGRRGAPRAARGAAVARRHDVIAAALEKHIAVGTPAPA